MSYWGYGADENDFAFKKQMFRDIENDSEGQYPEQSIIGLLVFLRLISERFPYQQSIRIVPKNESRGKY